MLGIQLVSMGSYNLGQHKLTFGHTPCLIILVLGLAVTCSVPVTCLRCSGVIIRKNMFCSDLDTGST